MTDLSGLLRPPSGFLPGTPEWERSAAWLFDQYQRGAITWQEAESAQAELDRHKQLWAAKSAASPGKKASANSYLRATVYYGAF